MLRFDGLSNYFNLPNLMAGATAGEIFVVARLQDFSNPYNGLIHFGAGYATVYAEGAVWDDFGTTAQSPYAYPDTPVLTHSHLYNSSVSPEGESILRINGREVGRRTDQTVLFSANPEVGADRYGEGFKGEIAEILVYDRVLALAEREAVSASLAAKYALPLASALGQPVLQAIAASFTATELTWTVPAMVPYRTTLERQSGNDEWTVLVEADNTAHAVDPGLNPGQTYSYRIKQQNQAGESTYSEPVTVTLPSAGELPRNGLRLWLRADLGIAHDESDGVTRWLDQSGLNQDATQAIGPVRPRRVTNAVNGRPVVRFDGVDDYLEVPPFMGEATAGELFVIVKLPGFAMRDDGLWTLGGADGTETEIPDSARHLTEDFGRDYRTDIGVPVTPLTGYVIYNVSAATGEWTVRLNSVTQFHSADNTVRFGGNGSLGRALGKYLQGDIAEVIAYDRVLTAGERMVVASDLNGRYAVVAAPHAPTNLVATMVSPSKVRLTWTEADSVKALAYTIERKTGPLGEYTVLASVTNASGFLDVTAAAGASQVYRIKAEYILGNSPYSNETTVTTSVDTDGDDVSDADEVALHTDPQDYYNGQAPLLTVLSGDNQWAKAGQFLAEPVIILVTGADGTPLVRAPLSFSIRSGGGQVSTGRGGPGAAALQTSTTAQGQAAVFWQVGPEADAVNVLSVSTIGPDSVEVLIRANLDARPPYAAVKLIPSTLADAAKLTPVKITDSGYVLLGYTSGNHGDPVGQRWKAGGFMALHSSTANAIPVWPGPVDVSWMRSGYGFYPHTDSSAQNWWAESVRDINESGNVVGMARFGDVSSPAHVVHYAMPVWASDSGTAQPRFTNSDMPLDASAFIYYAAFFGATMDNAGTIYTSSYQEELFGDGEGDKDIGILRQAAPSRVLESIAEKKSSSDLLFYVSPDGSHRLAYWGKTFPSTLNERPMAHPAIGPINNSGRYIAKTMWGEGDGGLKSLPGLVNGSALAINRDNAILARLADASYSILDWQVTPGSGPDAGYYFQNSLKFNLPAGWELKEIAATLNASGQMLGLLRRMKDDNCTTLSPADQTTVPAIFVQAQLAVDADRDGVITLNRASDRISSDKPYRFWINDDDDSGDVGGSDISDGSGSDANYRDQVVNGTRDLIDFFPVFLDLKQLLAALPPGGPVHYKLKQADSALNFAYTNLARETTATREGAMSYQTKILNTGFGDRFDQPPGAAATHQITAGGVELSKTFLSGVKDSDWGVLLIEGRAATRAPLVLSVEKDEMVIAELRLDLRISNVEAMFRHVSLAHIPTEYDGSPITPPAAVPSSRTGDPGDAWPDTLTNGKYFVFIHGYNVDGQRARGWQSEIFKRLHVLGSNARFVGVTWNGATGAKIAGDYTDYHQAVFQAFQTGEALAGALSFTNGADVTVAAHSLGNVVASHAIQRGGFKPDRYFLINAAVPMEAYAPGDVTTAEQEDMVEHDWKSYDARLLASNWHSLFPASDHRSELTWENRFYDAVPKIYDFFSPGDDVVAKAEGIDTASVAVQLLRQGFDTSTGVWKAQELVKGVNWPTSAAALLMGRGQAGWGFNPAWYLVRGQTNSGQIYSRRFSDEAREADVPTSTLKILPFFNLFLETALTDSDTSKGSIKAGEKKMQYDVLARGIPSKSYAIATRRLSSLSDDRNFNMETKGREQNQWPIDGHMVTGNQGRWLHSDFKAVALPYVHKMYEVMIANGALK